MFAKYLGAIIKIGAISSLIGTSILILLIIVILIFPIQKNCDNNNNKCIYVSTAPSILNTLVNPKTLVTSLLTISAGILIFRFGTWYQIKKSRL